MEEHVETHEREIRAIPGNGYCLINTIIECMATDFNHHIKQQYLLDQIVDELYENDQRYAPFYQSTKKEMIKKAELYSEDASKVYVVCDKDGLLSLSTYMTGFPLTRGIAGEMLGQVYSG